MKTLKAIAAMAMAVAAVSCGGKKDAENTENKGVVQDDLISSKVEKIHNSYNEGLSTAATREDSVKVIDEALVSYGALLGECKDVNDSTCVNEYAQKCNREREEIKRREESEKAAEANKYDANIIHPTGYGPFKLHGYIHNVAKEVPGLYDKSVYSAYNHEMDMDIPGDLKGYYTYTLNGKNPIYVTVDNKDNIVTIQVNNPAVKSYDEIQVGDPMSKLTSDSRFRPSENVMTDYWQSDRYYYVSNGEKVTGIFVGREY